MSIYYAGVQESGTRKTKNQVSLCQVICCLKKEEFRGRDMKQFVQLGKLYIFDMLLQVRSFMNILLSEIIS